jgi:cobyrinic acid a,c-diamide synthase
MPPFAARRLAIAEDAAFAFVYPHLLRAWKERGTALLPFSPLADEAPDAGADGIFLPGGYPELHAARLAASRIFLDGLRRAAQAGTPVYGECGGYMALGETLTDAEGVPHRMAGLLPLATSFAARRLHLGYREVTLAASGPLGEAGSVFRGHEFHYASVLGEGPAEPLFRARDGLGADLGPAGLRLGSVMGSFLHLIDRN